MGAIPQALMEQIAERAQQECADESAALVCKVIKTQPEFAITPEWLASIAATLSEKAKALRKEPREIAQNYLDDLHDDMKGCV